MSAAPLDLVISPCPNDTFVYWAWIHRRVPGAPTVAVRYHDIDVTNTLAAGPDAPDLVKVSYAALPWLLERHRLLPLGGALGRGCGPLLLTARAVGPDWLPGRTVAVPGERTTAYLLARLWASAVVPGPLGRIVVMPFEKIMPAVRDGSVDAGLVIHEARFTYPRFGLTALVDLGQWWESDTGLPIPLGAILARRELDPGPLVAAIRGSVEAAWATPEATMDYVLAHAQEMNPDVAKAHIALYVNEFTRDVGDEGAAAVRALLDRAATAGLAPAIDPWA